ncbi:MAG: DUF4160 domain-containing protein [Pseudomonadota bacterium]
MPAYIFYDEDVPGDILVFEEYTLRDFVNELKKNDPDCAQFFLELSDKAPYTDFITQEYFYHIEKNPYVINGWASDINLHRMALLWNMFLFSLPNHGWNTSEIKCYHGRIELVLNNICDQQTGLSHIVESDVVQRVFDLTVCKVYVYYGDHPPPHIHVCSPNSRCVINVSCDDFGAKICGKISERDHKAIKEFLVGREGELNAVWEVLNPKVH